jgi:hypothetical protein
MEINDTGIAVDYLVWLSPWRRVGTRLDQKNIFRAMGGKAICQHAAGGTATYNDEIETAERTQK